MNKNCYNFIRGHNLVNRTYDMVVYFGLLKNPDNEKVIKRFFKQRLIDVEYIESLTCYFEKKLRKHKNNINLRCDLIDLIYDLEYLKQYLL